MIARFAGERTMGAFTDLLAKLDERCTRLDQIVEAIADIRRPVPTKKAEAVNPASIAISRSNQKAEA
jgi:hypothetical protein